MSARRDRSEQDGMNDMASSEDKRAPRRTRAAAFAIPVLGLLLAAVATAVAAGGLLNASFEDDLDNWTVSTGERTNRGDVYDTNRTVVYGEGGSAGPEVPCDDSPYGICVVGDDTFGVYDSEGEREITVEPLDGDKMLRLGGPFGNARVLQAMHDFRAEQTFRVDPENPVLNLNYNLFSFDKPGYDRLDFVARLTDESGDVVVRDVNRPRGSGTDLKTSGWTSNDIDLSSYAGQELTLQVSLLANRDEVRGSWAYIDAGLGNVVPVEPGEVEAEAPKLPGGGRVFLNQYTDPGGETFFTVPSFQVAEFPDGCMPLTITVPINPGAGTLSDVTLLFGNEEIPMTNVGDNLWSGEIECVANRDLAVRYTLTEGETSQEFTVPIGGIVLIDPQGVVFDQEVFDEEVEGGATPADARATAAIEGATVTLQRKVEGEFVTVLSGDPGITPNVNPEITGEDGLYQWDVSEGAYRVVVRKGGYLGEASPEVTVPPPVTDLHIGLEKFETEITSGPSGPTADATPTFGFAANDPGSVFECAVDGAPVACSAADSHTTSSLAEGPHTFSVAATDGNGFEDPTPAERSFSVDTTPPATTIDSGPAEGSVIESTSAQFEFHSADASATFECALDGAAFSGCTSPQQLTGLAAGPHTFKVRATDALGNVETTPQTRTFTVDQTAPETTITSGPAAGATITSSTASFGFSSDKPGASFECKLDAGAFTPCTAPRAFAGLGDGQHTFSVRAKSAGGLIDSSPATRPFRVDTTPPDTRIDAAPAKALSVKKGKKAKASVAFGSTESSARFECSLDGSPFAPCASPAALSLGKGSHTFAVRAVDAVGHRDGSPATAKITVKVKKKKKGKGKKGKGGKK